MKIVEVIKYLATFLGCLILILCFYTNSLGNMGSILPQLAMIEFILVIVFFVLKNRK